MLWNAASCVRVPSVSTTRSAPVMPLPIWRVETTRAGAQERELRLDRERPARRPAGAAWARTAGGHERPAGEQDEDDCGDDSTRHLPPFDGSRDPNVPDVQSAAGFDAGRMIA